MACTYHRALLLEDDVPSCEGTFNAMARTEALTAAFADGPTVRALTSLHIRDELVARGFTAVLASLELQRFSR